MFRMTKILTERVDVVREADNAYYRDRYQYFFHTDRTLEFIWTNYHSLSRVFVFCICR